MGDETPLDRYDPVRGRSSVSGPAPTDRGPNRGSVSLRFQGRTEPNIGLGDPPEPAEAVDHDVSSEIALGCRRGVLPVTPSTPVAHMVTRWVKAARVALDHIDELRLYPASVLDRRPDHDPLTGQCPLHEHDPAVGALAETGATGGDPVHVQFELWHDVEAMATTDPLLPTTLIVPSILPADFSRLGEECQALERAGVDRIQFDVMDGRFVPNLTFGPDVIASVRPLVDVDFEAHLMIEQPDHLIPRFVEAGCGMIIVHVETCVHLHRTLAAIGELGASAAVALNPHTPLDAVANVIDLLDMLLVMTVNPGFGGQAYIATMEPKIASARALLDTADRWVDLEVDGGISPLTIPGAASAGANVFISGSALYGHPDGLETAVGELRALAEKAIADQQL